MSKKGTSNPARTVLTITVGFIVIYLITQLEWALIVAVSVGAVGILSNYLSKQIDWLWMKLAWVLSLIVPNILLSLVFYIILFPVALISKLFGKKDQLQLKNTATTTFVTVDKTFDKESFEKPW